MRYFIELAYNGKRYHGWQNQPNAITVQEVLEKALSTLLKTEINIVGAGRTDTGVHAKQMFAHFDFEDSLDSNIVFKLNQFLPNDIAISSIREVKPNAHARFDAETRTYTYVISMHKDPFLTDVAYLIKSSVDLDKMNMAAKMLLNYKNFKCFSRSHTDVKTYNCKLIVANWEVINQQLVFTITADRFLRNMVRAIVGTLLEIGSGKMDVMKLDDVIKSEDRSMAGPSVPAHGLFLTSITYPKDTFLNVRD